MSENHENYTEETEYKQAITELEAMLESNASQRAIIFIYEKIDELMELKPDIAPKEISELLEGSASEEDIKQNLQDYLADKLN